VKIRFTFLSLLLTHSVTLSLSLFFYPSVSFSLPLTVIIFLTVFLALSISYSLSLTLLLFFSSLHSSSRSPFLTLFLSFSLSHSGEGKVHIICCYETSVLSMTQSELFASGLIYNESDILRENKHTSIARQPGISTTGLVYDHSDVMNVNNTTSIMVKKAEVSTTRLTYDDSSIIKEHSTTSIATAQPELTSTWLIYDLDSDIIEDGNQLSIAPMIRPEQTTSNNHSENYNNNHSNDATVRSYSNLVLRVTKKKYHKDILLQDELYIKEVMRPWFSSSFCSERKLIQLSQTFLQG
jgi:hypothetical protein